MKDMYTLSPSTAQASLTACNLIMGLAPQEPWPLEPITHGVGAAAGRLTPSDTATAFVTAGKLLWN